MGSGEIYDDYQDYDSYPEWGSYDDFVDPEQT